jgi:hypothetical protein
MSEKKDYTWLITIVGVLALLGLGAGLWHHSMNVTPVVNAPYPKMPSPNAYDYYVDAARLVKDNKKIAEASNPSPKPLPQPSGPGPTASPTPGPTSPGAQGPAPTAPAPPHVYSLAEKDALVRKNAAALARLRQGFAYRYQSPPIRSWNHGVPYLMKFRDLGRLLSLEGQTKAAHGDRGGAMDSYLDAIRFGGQVPHGKSMMEMSAGRAIQRIGRNPAWKCVNRLSAADALSSVRKLEKISRNTVDFADVLEEEKWILLSSSADMLRDVDFQRRMFIDDPFDLRFLFCSKRAILANLASFMDRSAADARRPYQLRRPLPLPNDPLSEYLCPQYTRERFVYVEEMQLQNSLLTVSLSLRAYKLQNGIYPTSLTQLTPSCLKTLPKDPFSLKGTFRYKLKGENYVLYSVGPDGKDNGGTAVFNPSVEQDRQYSVEESSVGDIVAGVNTR